MLQRRSRTQSRPGSAPAQCSLVPLKNTEEEQASRSNEDIRYIGEKPVDSFKFFPANDSLGDDQNSNASVLLSVASKSSENLVDSPKCNSEILIPPVTATSSGYSSSGGSPINMSEAAGSSDCTREADASGQNDTDVTENENIMEEERPALGFQTENDINFSLFDDSVGISSSSPSWSVANSQLSTKNLQIVLTDCCQPVVNIPRTQLGQKSFPSTELSVHQSSLPPRDLQNFVMGGSLNPSNGRDFRQESFEHDNMSLKFSSDPQNHPNELSEITFGRRSPAILSSNRSSSSSPVESLAVASQRCQQRPPRKRREIGPRGQSAFTIGRLTAGSQFRVTTSAPSRLLPALNPQDSVSSSDDETGHSSGPQRQSSSRPAAEHQGNSQFDRLFQGSKWKKMKKSRTNESSNDEPSTSAGPSGYRLDDIAVDYSNLEIHSSGGSDHSRSPSLLGLDRNAESNQGDPITDTFDLFDTVDFEQADNAVNEMLERSTADSGFYRPLRDVSRPSESPERVLAQVQADEVLARRLQQEYDAEVAASQLSTLERDELIPPSTSRLSSLAFGRRIAQAGRRGRGTQRFELSSDEVTSSFEYTTAEDDEEVLQRRQMREEQDEEVAAIFSRAAPTADIRPEGQRGRGGRQHPRRIPFERTRLLGITRPTAALRNGPEIHSSSDTEGPATESTDNLNFLQQLTAPRRRFGGRPLPPRPVGSVLSGGGNSGNSRPRADPSARLNHYQNFLDTQAQPFVRLGHLRFSTDRDGMGEVIARSTEDDSVSEDAGPSGRQRRARLPNTRSTRGSMGMGLNSNRFSTSVRLRVPAPYVHMTRLPPFTRSAGQEMADYEELIELAEALGDAPGLSQAQISRLPLVVYKKSQVSSAVRDSGDSFDDSSCRICMCDYEHGEQQRILTCFHRFHSFCIDEWLKRKVTCPICRVDVRQTEPSYAAL